MQDMRAHKQVGDAGCCVCQAGWESEGGQRGNFQAEAFVEGTANITMKETRSEWVHLWTSKRCQWCWFSTNFLNFNHWSSSCMLSHFGLLVTLWIVAHQAPLFMQFPGKNTGVACHFLFQGIFLTQGANPRLLQLLHCRWILYLLRHQGSPLNSWQPILKKNRQANCSGCCCTIQSPTPQLLPVLASFPLPSLSLHLPLHPTFSSLQCFFLSPSQLFPDTSKPGPRYYNCWTWPVTETSRSPEVAFGPSVWELWARVWEEWGQWGAVVKEGVEVGQRDQAMWLSWKLIIPSGKVIWQALWSQCRPFFFFFLHQDSNQIRFL